MSIYLFRKCPLCNVICARTGQSLVWNKTTTFCLQTKRKKLSNISNFVGKAYIFICIHTMTYCVRIRLTEMGIIASSTIVRSTWWEKLYIGEIHRILNAFKTHISMIKSTNEYWLKANFKKATIKTKIPSDISDYKRKIWPPFDKRKIKFIIFKHC